MTLAELAERGSIVICCGSGGVGKTTAAAAIAVQGARLGRRACVVTIDPAKRLADALGLEALSNQPNQVKGDWPGELWALMLDTKSTFDDLITRYAGSSAQSERILGNRLYRNISAALSGTQEYMAMEKLFELYAGDEHGQARFDLIVVDTPPTRNALDFLDAPRRLTRFLDNRLFRLLIMPTRAYLKAVSVAAQTFVRTVARAVGSEVVDDAVSFFQAFEGMEAGFRERAQRVLDLLASDDTAFVLVASPRRDTVREALFFADKLDEAGLGVQALVVNRVHPRFAGDTSTTAAAARSRAKTLEGSALGVLFANLADFDEVAEREESHFAELAARVAPAPVARVPFLAADVHDLDGLAVVASHLFPA